MAEYGEIGPRQDREGQQLGATIRAFEENMLRNNPLFDEARRVAGVLGRQRFDTRQEARQVARNCADSLDRVAESIDALGQVATLQSDEIWVQQPEMIAGDSDDVLLRTTRLCPDDTDENVLPTVGGRFHGFVDWAAEDDENDSWRPVLAYQMIRGLAHSRFVGPHLYGFSEIGPATQLEFQHDQRLTENKQNLMTLSGRDTNGNSRERPLVSNHNLIEFLTSLNSAREKFGSYSIDHLVAAAQTMLAEATSETVTTACLQAEGLIMSGLGLGPRHNVHIKCSKIVDREMDSWVGDDPISRDTSSEVVTRLTGVVLAVEFITDSDEKLLAHFVVDEQIDGSNKKIPVDERKLRLVPLRAIKSFETVQ